MADASTKSGPTTTPKTRKPATRKVRKPVTETKQPVTAAMKVVKSHAEEAMAQARARAEKTYNPRETAFASRLRKVREDAGLTKDEMADSIMIVKDRPTPKEIEKALENIQRGDKRTELIRQKSGNYVVRRPMVRSGYVQYENGVSTPNIDLIEQIAESHGVDPLWLAFGYVRPGGGSTLRFDPKAGFVREEDTSALKLDLDWVSPTTAVFYTETFLGDAVPGEAVLVDTEDKLSKTAQRFLVGVDGDVEIAHAHLVQDGEKVRVYEEGLKTFKDYDISKVSVAGRYIGRIAQA